MRFTFEIAGDKQIERELLRVGSRSTNAAPAFSAIADFMIEETRLQFDTQGGHGSGGWQPLQAATVRAKVRHHPPLDPRILHATLALAHSLTDRGDKNMVLDIRPQELRYGSKLPYAAAHQNPKSSNPLPQRRPIAFTEHARREIIRKLQRYLVTGDVT